MIPPALLKKINRKPVKLALTIWLCIILSFTSTSNVLYIDHSIMEIYFDAGGWSIELFMDYEIGDENLEGMRMTGLFDTVNFLPRVYEWGEPFLVTQADFESPLYINQAGDWLFLEILIGDEWFRVDEFGLNFGEMTDPQDTWVSSPVGEESVGWQLFFYYHEPPPGTTLYWWTVKQLPNSLGISPPWEVETRAIFYGYVVDTNNYHIPGVRLAYCEPQLYESDPSVPELITDWNGYFYTNEMFCRKYKIEFLKGDAKIGETTVFIEPDSDNFFIFRVDTLVNRVTGQSKSTSEYSIITVPNPSTFQTTFIVESGKVGPSRTGVIKIYNEAGYIVDIIPIEIDSGKKELVYNFKGESLQSGTYIYCLELERAVVASGKMIIRR